MMAERYAFPAAGLDLHQRGITFRELAAALALAQLTAAAWTEGSSESPEDLAEEAVTAADALCDALDGGLPDAGG
jgi:methylmalonyl-CoA mutase cobalamin-binding subunit